MSNLTVLALLTALTASLAMTGTQANASSYLDKAKDSHGCTVLLCLAAVGTAPKECLSALNKLTRDLLKGKSFPSCEFLDSPPVFAARGVTAPDRPLPTTRQGRAAYIPEHTRCLSSEERQVKGGKNDMYETFCLESVLIEEHYEPDRNCAEFFQPPSGAPKDIGGEYDLYKMCMLGSKKYVKVESEGIETDYFYY